MLPAILSIFLLAFVAAINLQLLATSRINTLLFDPQRDHDLYVAAAFTTTTRRRRRRRRTNVDHDEQQPCNNNDDEGLSMNAFLHPQNLNHGMSDEELFWRASLLVANYYPFHRVPKVAFMFLTRGPLTPEMKWKP
ncbi:unnamed protein product [Linum trigynum]|uniref:Uncharacterized protein n=1 Tax=Linum trigynum TaxID=586398 RepID=A0AAV2DP73_9ROSI